jgi:hypothetical protein
MTSESATQPLPSDRLGNTSAPNRYVEVRWIDCQGDADGWTPVSALDAKACVCVTVGILIEPPPRPDHLSVALSMYDHDDDDRETQVGDVVHIFRPMVVGVRTLGFADLLPSDLPVRLSFPTS